MNNLPLSLVARMMVATKAGVEELMEVDSSRGGEEKMYRTWFFFQSLHKGQRNVTEQIAPCLLYSN